MNLPATSRILTAALAHNKRKAKHQASTTESSAVPVGSTPEFQESNLEGQTKYLRGYLRGGVFSSEAQQQAFLDFKSLPQKKLVPTAESRPGTPRGEIPRRQGLASAAYWSD